MTKFGVENDNKKQKTQLATTKTESHVTAATKWQTTAAVAIIKWIGGGC